MSCVYGGCLWSDQLWGQRLFPKCYIQLSQDGSKRKESQFSISKLCVNKAKSSYHLSISALLILYLKSSYCIHRCSFRPTGNHHVHSVWRVILFRRLAWASDCLSHRKSPQLFEAPLLDHYLPTGVEVLSKPSRTVSRKSYLVSVTCLLEDKEWLFVI